MTPPEERDMGEQVGRQGDSDAGGIEGAAVSVVRAVTPIPEVTHREISLTTLHIVPMVPGEALVPVVFEDGILGASVVPVRRIGPSGLWGCATCEQLHPVAAKTCPLLGGPVRDVIAGPYEVDGEPVYFAGKGR